MSEMISVIIPIYKTEKTLSKCIESVLHQTHKDLEIILVDDGSPDRCPLICDEYAERDNRIKVIHKKNGGLSSARNAGLDIAQGDYIGFIDSDDYISREMYEVMLCNIKKENADMCICDVSRVKKDGTSIEEVAQARIQNEVLTKEQIFNKQSTYYITVVNRLYDKKLFNDLRFRENRLHEDEFIYHHIYDRCKKIVTISNRFYYYVQNPESIMNSKYSIKRLDGAYAFFERYVFFKERNDAKQARKAIRSCYGRLYICLTKLSYADNKEYIKPLLKPTILGLGFDLRNVKLFFALLNNILFF